MISRPAPADPPIIETMRLGIMAMHLVIRFLSHFLILSSKKPYTFKKIELVPFIFLTST